MRSDENGGTNPFGDDMAQSKGLKFKMAGSVMKIMAGREKRSGRQVGFGWWMAGCGGLFRGGRWQEHIVTDLHRAPQVAPEHHRQSAPLLW